MGGGSYGGRSPPSVWLQHLLHVSAEAGLSGPDVDGAREDDGSFGPTSVVKPSLGVDVSGPRSQASPGFRRSGLSSAAEVKPKSFRICLIG